MNESETADTSSVEIIKHIGQLNLVRWVDSCVSHSQAWHDINEVKQGFAEQEYPNDMSVETVGFLVYEDSSVIVLALSMWQDEIGPYQAIPKVCVLNRTQFPRAVT